ncbi:MAG TPA: hypothetical protein VHW23_22170 [Kofleriaceae bacterium]|nr:hypothetical protein [Kofleriaceae bacterium]
MRSRLTPEPGTHIEALIARGGHVLALIAEGRQLHGRWITIDHGARWGSDTPKLPGSIEHAVLSPSGQLLAAVPPRSLHPVLIDLATGARRKVPLCVERRWPHENGDDSIDDNQLLHSNNAPRPLGFLNDGIIACAVMSQLVWWNTEGTLQPVSVSGMPVAGLPAAMIGGALVVGAGPSLAFLAPDSNWFLGYSAHDLNSLHVGASGALVGTSDQQALLLDLSPGPSPGPTLRERTRFELNRGEWVDAAPIDDRYALTTLARRLPAQSGPAFQLAVFDGLTAAVHQLLPYTARDRESSYDPDSRLLATSDGAIGLLLRYDPAAHVFGEPVRVGGAIAQGKLAVLDPRRSHGVAALAIAAQPDGLLVGELTEADLRPGTTALPRTTYRVPGELRAVDRAGDLYIHPPDNGDDVVVYARDLAVARLAGLAKFALRPSPDGARIAAFEGPRLTLLSSDGHVRWDSAQWSVADAGWTASGELVVQFPTGIARVDLETGELTDRRCGWEFGRLDHMPDSRSIAPSICDVAR